MGVADVLGDPIPEGAIVFAVPDFEPAVGGTTRQVGLQARALARRGHPVAVVTRRLRPSWARLEWLGELPVHRVGPVGYGRARDKAAAAALGAWLLRHRDRIAVFQPVMWTDAVFGAAAANLLPRTAVIWAIKGDATIALHPNASLTRGLQSDVRRRVLERCRHVVLTESMAEELASVGLGATTVIPVPIDTRAFRPPSADERAAARDRLQIPGDALAIVFAGHLQVRKGVDRLVDAFARLLADGAGDARLVLVGGSRGAPDDVEPQLREQVRRLGIGDRVRFCGVVQNPREQLWASDVFVLPSLREGMPNSILEAMACGLACVAPPSASGPELITPETGIVPASNDPADLLAALRTLALDPERRAAMGRAAIEHMRAYDIEHVTDAYESLYTRIAGPVRAPA
jgi:glycosyltransferase involved in cell wall biosynthesis